MSEDLPRAYDAAVDEAIKKLETPLITPETPPVLKLDIEKVEMGYVIRGEYPDRGEKQRQWAASDFSDLCVTLAVIFQEPGEMWVTSPPPRNEPEDPGEMP